MYDDTCRFLAENFSADFASWLLGEAIVLTELEPSELSLEPSQTTDPEATLRQVSQVVNRVSDPTTQANLIAASAILAGIKLEDDVIYRLLRKDIMQESSVYRSILKEGQAEGEARAKREIAVNLLRGGVAINVITASTGLPLEEVQQLQQQLSNSQS